MKRLLLTCTDLMAIQFLVPHVKYLSSHGFSVELACSVVGDRLGDLHRELDGIAPDTHRPARAQSVFTCQPSRLRRPEKDNRRRQL